MHTVRGVLLAGGLLLMTATIACGAGQEPENAAGAGSPQPTSTVSESPSSSAPTTSSSTPPATSTEPTGQPARPRRTECTAGTLRLDLVGGEGAAGTVYRSLKFTNSGGESCVIQGFPGVSYVTGDSGQQVGPAALREGTKGAPITLAPGSSASVDVGFTNVRNFAPADCRPTKVRGLRVYPPHDTAAMFVPFRTDGCASTPPDPQLTVRTAEPN
ncbi:MAG: DUF4232 domain-containing protein [Pseudonocardiaceae bacterium]|nr:DUF4232 domain-containing protein [Pseudonocardiaceae bacterium]